MGRRERTGPLLTPDVRGHRLLTGLEIMQEFRAFGLMQSLGTLLTAVHVMPDPRFAVGGSYHAVAERMRQEADRLRSGLMELGGCPVTVNKLEAIKVTIPEVFDNEARSLLCRMTLEIVNDLASELESHKFLFLDKGVDLFEARTPFGDLVDRQFPSARQEVREAARCIALERPTAAACHLARSLEVVLTVLHVQLETNKPNARGWNRLIEAIQERLTQFLREHPERESEDHAFFARASETFDHVRSGWRNDTMHAGVFYTDEEARDLYESVRVFMNHLAQRFGEGED